MNTILANYRRFEGKYLPQFHVLKSGVEEEMSNIRAGMMNLMDNTDSWWDVSVNTKKPACYNIPYVCSWKEFSWKGVVYNVIASHVENFRNRRVTDEEALTVYFLLQVQDDKEGALFYGQTKQYSYTRNQFLEVSGLEIDGVWSLADFYSTAQVGFHIRRCAIHDFLSGLCRLAAYGAQGENYGADSFFAKVLAREGRMVVA
jgi:hypothetical protein